MIRLATLQAPQEDRTERAMFEAFLVADEFRVALAEAQSLDRVFQIKERIKVTLAELVDVENDALQRADVTLRRMN